MIIHFNYNVGIAIVVGILLLSIFCLKFVIRIDRFIKKGDEFEGVLSILSRNSATLSISALCTIFVALIFISTNAPIKIAIEPVSLEENLTFKDEGTNFSKNDAIELSNIGQDLNNICLDLDIIGCNATLFPNIKNNEYVASGETIYLAFNLTVSPKNLSNGVYRGSIQIGALPIGGKETITIGTIPVVLKYAPKEKNNLDVVG